MFCVSSVRLYTKAKPPVSYRADGEDRFKKFVPAATRRSSPTSATKSAQSGHHNSADECPLLGVKRTFQLFSRHRAVRVLSLESLTVFAISSPHSDNRSGSNSG